ncbi:MULTISPECIES: NRDE family protein [Pseudomonas]|uniref:NRDE family protein n=1 Tax=Pseudomonas TaxID=286 RepID=UPI0018AAE0C9|nr:NRDE family protein [Pseudomonas guariconensis]MBF8721211.1 NRDE family protein [Pseudomonas guariconensis]MBF8743471.1 NRDE family protein [Pseudomonas guariconensis]MBF8752235.1 NRDE family protein [Pseudomonas guariconensis]MBF8793199.1 NRDE family protein [Pseudomonas monteilii]
MCLIVFAWRPGHALPLIVAANRDEFYARPTQALGAWEDAPGVHAGRDLEAGGTWLGVGPNGRFAALTNIRDPGQPLGPRSRGELVAAYLSGTLGVDAYLDQVASRASQYSGFNLLVGDGERLGYLHAREAAPRLLEPGIYGVSNAGLDTPWPKLVKARRGLQGMLDNPDPQRLLGLLGDGEPAPEADLPETGVGLATEKLLSSVFIASQNYGTRASTVLIVDAQGRRRMIERSFGPFGGHLGEVEILA